jgi:hypothetical protein
MVQKTEVILARSIIFTSLAGNQTAFFSKLSKELGKKNIDCHVINFHETSNKILEEDGIDHYNIYDYFPNADLKNAATLFREYISKYKIGNPNLLFSHERTNFNITRSDELKLKYVNYLHALEKITESIISKNQNQNITVIQETGGFASLISMYYISRYFELDHWFLEPSFFKGRIFATKNSIYAPEVIQENISNVSQELIDYLDKTKRQKDIVIPVKDKSHYQSPWKKILNSYNLKRLFIKSYEKHVLKKREEFSYIFHHVKTYVRMYLNKMRLGSHYQQLPNSKYIYFPFHVPGDVALTIRTPEFLDQYSLIDYLARIIPLDYKLVIKEHPARVGAVAPSRILEILKNYDNVALLDPTINTYDILENMDLLITINSKTGAEAISNGKRVITMGDAFYKRSSLTTFENNLTRLPATIQKCLQQSEKDESEVTAYLQNIWDQSFPGEIYSTTDDKIQQFADGLINAVN